MTIVFHLLAPSAMRAFAQRTGTARRNSSVLRSEIGIIMTPSATPPARVEKCLKENDQPVREDADDDGRHAVQQVGGIADDERAVPC